MEVDKIMQKQDFKKYKIYHYTSLDYKKRANAAYLMGGYLIIFKKKTTKEAWDYFSNVKPSFTPFRDAISGECTYLRGLEYAIQLVGMILKLLRLKNLKNMLMLIMGI